MSRETGTTERYCPLCDTRMPDARCPRDAVETVPWALIGRPEDHLEAGARIGGLYEIRAPIGRGSMGTVYAARAGCDGRDVALKIMSKGLVEGGTEGIRRFYHEATSARRVRHPHVVRVLDFGVDDARHLPFLVMERVEGRTLRELMRFERRVPLAPTAQILSQVASALAAAHGAGILHRDLKPENIMVRKEAGGGWHVTVLDFGIAKSLWGAEAFRGDLTAAGYVVGTPRYMSPEQIRGGALDGRVDLYALGCVFHEMLEGCVPFRAESATGVMLKQISSMRPVLSTRSVHDADGEACALHAALLAKDPAGRASSAVEVARRFGALARRAQEGAAARPRAGAPAERGASVAV